MQSRDEEKTCFTHFKNTIIGATIGASTGAAASVMSYTVICYALHFLIFTTDNVTLLKWVMYELPQHALEMNIPQRAAIAGAILGGAHGFFKSVNASYNSEDDEQEPSNPALLSFTK